MSTSFLQRARAVGGLLLVLTAGVGAHDVGRQKAEHAVEKTVVNSQTGYAQLLGPHKFQLHWISFFDRRKFGDLTVTDRQGLLVIHGVQRDHQTGDFVELDGIVTRVEDRTFDFRGRIVTRVSHINDGEPCLREGDMTFAIKGKRRFWRLQQMQNPCNEVVDYIDIFLR